MRPARMCAIAAVAAEIPLIAMFAPAPAAGDEATSSTTGRRRLPSTSPTTPPPSATRKHQPASRTSSIDPQRMEVLRVRQTGWMDSLFEPAEETGPAGAPAGAPLAARMRPGDLSEFVGQERLLSPGSALRTAIE